MRYSWDILNVRLGGRENPEITWLTAQPELCPRVAGEPTVWIAQKDHAYHRRKVPKRDDRSLGHTYYYGCAAHLHHFGGLASSLVAGTRDCITFGVSKNATSRR